MLISMLVDGVAPGLMNPLATLARSTVIFMLIASLAGLALLGLRRGFHAYSQLPARNKRPAPVEVTKLADTAASAEEAEPVIESESPPVRPDAPTERADKRSRDLLGRAEARCVAFGPKFAVLATSLMLAWILLPNLDGNPVGFFCDEAMIGIRTHQLVTERLSSFDFPIFYQHFRYHHLGALPLYAGAPVDLVFGLTVQSVRLQSVVWFILALLPLLAFVRRLDWRYGELGIVVFACTPVFLHLARFNFGTAPSLFCVAFGLACYARARYSASIAWALGAGIAIGLSAYGNGAYYVAAPCIIASVVMAEIVASGRAWSRYRPAAAFVAGAGVAIVPVIAKIATDPLFMRRFDDRQASDAAVLSRDRLDRVVQNYPKYFSRAYLIDLGESGISGPGSYRHSVPGAGEITWLAAALVLAGVVATFRTKDRATRFGGALGIALLLLYPLPDAILANADQAPYTISVFPMMIFVPVLAALGVSWIAGLAHARRPSLGTAAGAIVLVIALGGAYQFATGPYERYPMISAGYYGWQYGAEDAIEILRRSQAGYDALRLDGEFNEAYVFLDFFMDDEPNLRAKSGIGDFSTARSTPHTLYALRIENVNEWWERPEPIRRIAKIVYVLRYPDGTIAMVFLDVSPANDRGRGSMPW